VLLALQRLLVAMGPDSGAANGFLLPVLRYACDPGGPEARLQHITLERPCQLSAFLGYLSTF